MAKSLFWLSDEAWKTLEPHQDLQTQKSHRTNVLQAQELATHRNPI